MSGFSKFVVGALLSLGLILVIPHYASASVPLPGPERESSGQQRVFAPTTHSSPVASAATILGLSVVGLTMAAVLRSRILHLRRVRVPFPAIRAAEPAPPLDPPTEVTPLLSA